METTRTTTTTSASTTPGMVTGMFRDRESAERAYNALAARGYSKEEINVVMSDDTRNKHFAHSTTETELGSKAMEGAGVGSAIGGTLGAITGALVAIGTSIAIPGLGLVVAGPLAAAFAGAGAGGLTGGLLGGLVGSGIPEEHAKVYESGIKEGGIVVGVKPRNVEDADYVANEWKTYRGENIYR
ncbi:MAG: general stress protein [Bacteroidota bacterium]